MCSGLFPNPVSEKLYINMYDAAMFSDISIYSITGQLIYHSLLTNKHEEIEIDVANLSSGVYFVKLHSLKNVISNRFIKK